MKSLLRNIIINSASLYAVTLILEGVKVNGGIATYIGAGVALSVLSWFIKPILKLITLPINIITFGTLSFLITIVINSIILYLLTVFVPQISIAAFLFRGLSFAGFIIPQFSVSAFFAFIATAFILSFVTSIVNWVIKD